MAHQTLADLVAGVKDFDAGAHVAGLRPVGCPVPEHLPHLVRRGVHDDGVLMDLHEREHNPV